MIGKLEPVDLREIWKNEEKDFNQWLAENLDYLSDAVGIEMSIVEEDVKPGTFKADIIAKDPEDNMVVIENQLEQTDHDHLGKIITYLTNLEAKTAIWITKRPRAEHIRAVSWLNDVTPEDVSFYLVKLEAYKIGDSEPAPLFSVIVSPDPEIKDIRRKRGELAERDKLRLEFWEKLFSLSREKGFKLFTNLPPKKDDWISTGAGRSGFFFTYIILKDNAAIQLYIDSGDKDRNKRIFDLLFEKREKIESQFGEKLHWERLDDRIASRIIYYLNIGGLDQKEKWPEIQEKMVEEMKRFSAALKPYIKQIRI